ncbi:MAG: NHL repeat-containing protein [Lachnospiraceae bacterium]|nr:NHL repeat-containing protein [Lachnospiraceae bacterium]
MKRTGFISSKRKLIAALAAACALSLSVPMTAHAEVPYETYCYNYYSEGVAQPHVYLYDSTLSFSSFELSLKNPQDMFIQRGFIYIADTDNSRIVKTNEAGELLMEIKNASGPEDLLSKPQGVFVAEDGRIFVADSGNGRVVEYDKEGNFIRSIGRPVTDLIDDTVVYIPQKVVVDNDGRIYVSAYGINLGLIEFDMEGNFQSFMGAAQVSVSPFEYIWKNYFSTKEQRARMATIVPTEYSNIFVDKNNFIYATIGNLSREDMLNGADAVRRLNPTGKDILRRLGHYPINGDQYKSADGNWSSFYDITATEYGCYFILDNANGKVFGYDYDGNSLFVFGHNGYREGNVQNAVAIGASEDASKLYILDYKLNSILVYTITEYGEHLLSALRLNDLGDSEGSIAEWKEVLRLNGNSEFAYTGLGKNFLAEGDYVAAMDYFKSGNNRKYYSKALYYHRKELMERNFGKIMLILAIVILIPITIVCIRKIKRWAGEVRCNMQEN